MKQPAGYRYYWHHCDINSAPLDVTNAQGNTVWSGKYERFGFVRSSPLSFYSDPEREMESFEQNLRYAGQYFDNETGLHFNTFRFYDPQIGRFIMPDPIGLLGGMNLYQYAPNPLMWVDPLGLDRFLEIVGDAATTTGKKFQGAEIYKITSKVKVGDVTFKKGDYFYLDNLHKDHYETFSSLDKSKGVFNLDGSYNEKKSIKAAKRKGPDASMKANLKHNILKNKDDLIEGTFCYSLFENAFFDEVLLIDLIKNAKLFSKENNQDKDISNLLTWIVNGVDQCFVSNNDKDDYYSIENYSSDLEIKWKNVWRTEINEIISNSNNC